MYKVKSHFPVIVWKMAFWMAGPRSDRSGMLLAVADASSGAGLCFVDACNIPMNSLLTTTKTLRKAFASKFP